MKIQDKIAKRTRRCFCLLFISVTVVLNVYCGGDSRPSKLAMVLRPLDGELWLRWWLYSDFTRAKERGHVVHSKRCRSGIETEEERSKRDIYLVFVVL